MAASRKNGVSIRVARNRYVVKPLMEGQMNLGYYELLAGIWDEAEKQVGLCFVELLPGVYNEKFPDTVFKRGAKE